MSRAAWVRDLARPRSPSAASRRDSTAGSLVSGMSSFALVRLSRVAAFQAGERCSQLAHGATKRVRLPAPHVE